MLKNLARASSLPLLLGCAFFLVFGSSALRALELEVAVEIPRIAVAEYHRPYVAIWIEDGSQQQVANLVVWYELHNTNGEGESWLKDMRLWWRRGGRELAMPVDGISSATRPVGTHSLNIAADDARLADLAEGSYQLVVEAARELGGREVVKIPFTLPLSSALAATAAGKHELGQVFLQLKP